MGWTDDRTATLKKLWLDGLSATQIAKQLRGVTRNAVIGKVHRLGLNAGNGAERQMPGTARTAAAAKPKAAPRYTRASVPPSAAVSADGPALAPRRNALDFRNPGASASTGQRPPTTPPQRTEPPGSATVLTLTAHMCRWPIGGVQRRFLLLRPPRRRSRPLLP